MAPHKPCIDCGEREADVKRRRSRCRKCQYAREPLILRVCMTCDSEEYVRNPRRDQCRPCGDVSGSIKKMRKILSVDEIIVDRMVRGIHKGETTKGERKEAVRRMLRAGHKRARIVETLGITVSSYSKYREELRAEGEQFPDGRLQNKGTPGNRGGGSTRTAIDGEFGDLYAVSRRAA